MVNLFNIQHFCLNDGPGIRTVIFFKGCPLNCIWCHNPESKSFKKELSFLKEKCMLCKRCQTVCKNNVHIFTNNEHRIDRNKCVFCGACTNACAADALEILGKEYSYEEVLEEIAKDDVFFSKNGGVTFSGGEPFMQFEALYQLLKMCKEKGYSTCIETSGYAKTDDIIKSFEYTDHYLFDCKETDSARHRSFVGVDNTLILKNLDVLDKIGANVILRCPIIPDCNNRKEHFENIDALVKKYKCIKSVDFLPYHPLGIAKNEQIGKKSSYLNHEFLDKDAIREYCDPIKKNFEK